MIHLRVGNSAVMINEQVVGDSNGCPRANIVRAYAGQPVVKDRRATVTFAVGTTLETIAFNWLKEQHGENIKADVEMSEELTDKVTLTGHCDFCLRKPDGTFHITEHKSVSSGEVAKKIFFKSEYKPNNLCQLLHYQLIAEAETGTLLYTSATYVKSSGKDEKSVAAGDQKEFHTQILPNGVILVNGENAPFCVKDLLAWREYMADVVERKYLDSPPKMWEGVWSPCRGCWLQEVCEPFDEDRDDEKFWRGVESILDREGRR
jgi:hypothetical protein